MRPASLYLTATPRFRYVGCVPIACLPLAAHAVRRDRLWIGWLLVTVGVMFWSVWASILSFPILLHILAPVLMRYPYLNPWTLSVTAAVFLVTALAVADGKAFGL